MSGNRQFVYATAYSPWGRNVNYLIVYRETSFEAIDSTNQQADAKFGPFLWVHSGKLTSFYNGVMSTTLNLDGTITRDAWARELTTPTYFRAPAIQSETNVFAFGQFNLSYHYNGRDWARINIAVPNHTVSPIAFFYGQWANEKEVFVCDVEEGIVYHGR